MPKPNKLVFCQRWLAVAEEDLCYVKMAFENKKCANVAIFHAQQCAEKVLKVFLVSNNQIIEKTHDLVWLVKQCAQIDPLCNVLMRSALWLNDFESKTRYPEDVFIVVSLEMLKTSIDEAEYILNFVKKRMNVS